MFLRKRQEVYTFSTEYAEIKYLMKLQFASLSRWRARHWQRGWLLACRFHGTVALLLQALRLRPPRCTCGRRMRPFVIRCMLLEVRLLIESAAIKVL